MNIDNAIRDALNEAIKEPAVNASEVAGQILARVPATSGGGAAAGGAGAGGAGGVALGPSAFLAGSALIIGAVAGGLFALGNDGPAPVGSTLLASVPVYACPGEGQVGDLRAGDRPYIVGQSDGYFAVRNIRGGGEVVYIASQYVTPDADTAGLPTMNCDTDATLTVALPSPSPTPTPEPAPVPAEQPAAPAAPQPDPGPAPAPPPPPPPPKDETPPSIGQQLASPGTVTEQDGLGINCSSGTARTSTVSATITDATAVSSATITYTVPGASQTTQSMAKSGNTWSATFGPVPAGTVPDNTEPSVQVTITAKDAAGNTSTAATSVTVRSIAKCFG